ncbi:MULTISPECIES: hypothetical protein [Chitinophagaceae]
MGTWRYDKATNRFPGNEVPSQYYWYKNGYKPPIKYPLFVFNSDSTYTERFTEKNISKGHWSFQADSQLLNLYLFVDSTDWTGKLLISKHIAGKRFEENEFQISSSPEPTNGFFNIEYFKREKKG